MPEEVSFTSRGNKVAAHLYKPKNFTQNNKYAAIVVGHPASSCKEQTASIYAKHLVDAGFVVVTFDASYQGKSQGKPRYLQDPSARVEDFRSAVDYLTTLKFVDEERIGALGICASGGYVINATITDRRIKAVGTVTGVNLGRLYREGNLQQILQDAAKQRTLEARGGAEKKVQWIPNSSEQLKKLGINQRDVVGAVDYYTTPRGKHENSPNQLHYTSRILLSNWDAFHLIDKLLIQPVQVVVGEMPGAFGAYRDGYQIYDRAASKDKNIHVIKGVDHYDLYDQPKAVEEGCSALIPFYQKHLLKHL